MRITWLVVLSLAAGCTPSNSPPSPASSTLPAIPRDKPVASAGASDVAATPGTTTSERAADGTATPLSAKIEPPKDPNAAGGPDELIAGINNPDLVREFEAARKSAAENPSDGQAQMQYVAILQSIGIERMQNKEPDKGNQAFATSAEVARKLIAAKTKLPEDAAAQLGVVFYYDACVASLAQDADKAIAALGDAIQWGFNDFGLMERDQDLAFLRKRPDYSQLLATWKKTAQEVTVKHARDDLAAGVSFPFEFSLTDTTGKPIRLADFRGKVVIVDFWGTWCPPCRAEIPSFIKLQSTFAERGFQMIGLNQETGSPDESTQRINAFIAENGMNYPCAIIDESILEKVPEMESFPTTLFIDRTGKVRLKAVGLHPYSYLEAVVQTLLEEPK